MTKPTRREALRPEKNPVIRLRPFRGPRAFVENAALCFDATALTVTDPSGVEHRFDLDQDGPYSWGYIRDRLVIVDDADRAIVVTRHHLWDLSGWDLEGALGPHREFETRELPALRADGVAFNDRQLWDFVPRVALGPFMVGPLVLGALLDADRVSGAVALTGSAICLLVVLVCGVALVRRSRGIQVQDVDISAEGSLVVTDEGGDAAGRRSVQGARRLLVKRIQEAPALAFEVTAEVVPIAADHEPLAEPIAISTNAVKLIEAARDKHLIIELVPEGKVVDRKTFEVGFHPGRGVTVDVEDGVVRIRDHKGRTSEPSPGSDAAPARLVLLYGGIRAFPGVKGRLALLDRRGRAILQTPLRWWEDDKGGSREIFALAKAARVPVEVRDGRLPWQRPPLAPDGIRFEQREVTWYAIGTLGTILAMFLAMIPVFAVHDLVTPLPDWVIALVGGVVMVTCGALWWWFGLSRGSLRVWTKHG